MRGPTPHFQISSPKLETKFASYFGICKARAGKNNKNAPL